MAEYYFERENPVIRKNHIECFVQRFNEKKEGARPHIHLAVELIHVVEGDFKFYIDDHPYLAAKGETVLIRSNATHRIYSLQEGPAAYIVMKLSTDFVVEMAEPEHRAAYLLDLALLNGEGKTHWNRKESLEIAALAEKMLEEKKKNGYGRDIAMKLCMGEILLILLRDIHAETPTKEAANENLVRRIYDAIVYINEHYAEEISAEGCSAKLFLSYSYFSRHFKRITGHTFKDYLNLTRINQAEKALISTRKPITEIATECGFNNLSYFSAIFKKMKGVSPSALRETKSI